MRKFARARSSSNFAASLAKQHVFDIRNRKLANIVKRCRDLPGYELFQYVDESGAPVDITSSDVNAYLREISGADFTAKDFRTWAGTVLAARALQEFEKFTSASRSKKKSFASRRSSRADARQYSRHLQKVLRSSRSA